MIPSVRNSESQDLAVFEEAKCTRALYTPSFEAKFAKLVRERPGLQAFTVPELDTLLGSESKHYAYTKTWADARTDPIVLAHSSGSTGTPKPTTITNGVYSTYDNHRKITKIHGRKIQGYTLLEFEGGGRFYNPFPPFHLAGLFAMTIMPIFYTCTVCTGPPEKPPSGELLSQAMQRVPIRAAWCPPTVIEQLLEQPGGFEQASTLDWIMYTGGPLAQAVGDKLSQVTDVCQMYGSTETGPHVTLVPLPENWQWFEWHPLLENKMEDQGDGTYEMVVYKDQRLDWIRHLSHAYPYLDVWRTNDLFVRNPENPKLWKFCGRKDDVLVLSNGEKFNPVNMEGAIVGHELVRGALIVGTGRFQASLIVEPKPDLQISKEEFIEEIWPTIQKGNILGPAHGRIFKNKIVIGTPDKPFQRAGKGTVIRGLTTRLYANEVEALYTEEEIPKEAQLVSTNDPQTYKDNVRACVSRLFSDSFSDTDDLFVLGMDSLQTLELTKSLNRAFATQIQQLGRGNILGNNLYTHPTIDQLSIHLYRVFKGLEPLHASSASDRLSVMNKLIEKYSADLKPSKRTSKLKKTSGLCVAITGSTGSLGQQLLAILLEDEDVSKVYCLNRAGDAEARQVAAFQSRGLNRVHQLYRKAQFLTTNFDDSKLGLSDLVYERLQHELDAVIHNAWKVNFNHELSSFEDTHIRGVRHLIDFSITSLRQTHIYFVSSLSSVGNWPAVYGAQKPVPEIAMTDSNVAMKMGYGESKYVAESILHTAVDKAGVRATILRVGQLAGPLKEDGGLWNKTEWFPSLIKTSKSLGILPDAVNTIDWIPVDSMAQIILDLMHSEYTNQTSQVFNLSNPRSTEWIWVIPAIIEAWASQGTKIVPFAEWLDALAQKAGNNEDLEKYPAVKILEFYRGLEQEAKVQSDEKIKYEVKRAIGCSTTMAKLAPVDQQAMTTWLRQWCF